MFKKIGDWINDSLIDSIIGRVIDTLQQRYPATFAVIIAVATSVIVVIENVIVEAQKLCAETEICFTEYEYIAYRVIQIIAIIVGMLSGSMKFSEAKDKIKNKAR